MTEAPCENLKDEEEEEEELDACIDARFLHLCIDGDVEDLVCLLEDMARVGEMLTPEIINLTDSSGKTPVSHLANNGMIEMLELLEDIQSIEYNIPDSEGNTPLHFAAQAGHVDVVSFLLNRVRTINVDPVNKQGFTPLMKAALQGRIKCSKLLLFSGASPVRRDHGRGLTAAQWARFCSRNLCADSIEKFVRTAVPGGDEIADMAGTDGNAKGSSIVEKSTKQKLKLVKFVGKRINRVFGTPQPTATDPHPSSPSSVANNQATQAKKLCVPKVKVTLDDGFDGNGFEDELQPMSEESGSPAKSKESKRLPNAKYIRRRFKF